MKRKLADKEKLERLWNTDYLKAMGGNFLLFFSFYLLTPLLPIYLDEQFAADKDMIGLVLSGYVIAALLVRPFSGFIVDTFNRKKVLMACFFLFFVLFAGYVGAGTLLMFALVRTIHGLPFGAVTVANSTVAMDVLPSSRRSEGIGYYGLSNNLAMAVSPTVGIAVYHATGSFVILFWIAFVLAMVGFACVSTINLSPRAVVRKKMPVSLDRFFLTRAWLMAINIAFFGLCWGIMSNYVALYGKQVLGITDGTGLFFALLSIGLFTARLHGGSALRNGRIVQSCAMGTVVSLAGYMLFAAFQHQWAFYAAALLIGLGNGHMYPAFLNMFVKVARHDQRGTANSSILTSWDMGMGLGILLGGVLAEYSGFDATFWTMAFMQLAGTLLFLFFTKNFFLGRQLAGE
ncbi:MFS transporter [uncultured Muribaculum sp.]|uniref:MFS transporter n=4 Tax=uncultured Muribaculum sp. TaxID=1918613 RepID=UPI00339D6AAE